MDRAAEDRARRIAAEIAKTDPVAAAKYLEKQGLRQQTEDEADDHDEDPAV